MPAIELILDDLIVCATCGVERDAANPTEECPICADEHQYLLAGDQSLWPSAADVRESPARIEVTELEPGLWGLDVVDGIGIGQQAKIAHTAAGNVMVDVPAHISADAVEQVRALGELAAIMPTHPHMDGLQSAWSDALGAVPALVSAADEEWLGRRPKALRLYGPRSIEVVPGVAASQPGGHFRGSCVVHWTKPDGGGVLLTGDTIAPNPDRRTVAFMRSYPNRIPLSGAVVRRIAEHVSRYNVDRLYGNFQGAILVDPAESVRYSAQRHADWVSGTYDDLTS